MNQYKFLLFDLDGTISESAPGIMEGVEVGLAAVGIHESDPAVLQTFIGPPLNVRAKELYHMSDEDIVTFVTAFRQSYEKEGGILNTRPYPGIVDLIKDTDRAGLVNAVASSKPEPFVKEIMDHFGLIDSFSVICGSAIGDELTPRKEKSQKARIIAKAMDELAEKGFDLREIKTHAVMIGDTGYDIDGAKENRLPSIGVTYGYGSKEELAAHGADVMVDSVAELRKILLEK